MNDSLPPSTHNNPPPLTLAEKLTEDNADLVKRAAEIEAGLKRFLAAHPKIESDEADAIAANFIGRNGVVTGLLKIAEARRVEQVEPFLVGQRQVNGWYSALIEQLDTPESGNSLVKTLKALSTQWKLLKENREREAARKAAEEARQRAAAAEAEAMRTLDEEKIEQAEEAAKDAAQAATTAAAPAADFTRTTGSLGATTSLRTRFVFAPDESDLMALVIAVVAGKAPLEYLAFNEKRIRYAVRSEKLRECPGLTIKEERSV
jgi:hypothetical protein